MASIARSKRTSHRSKQRGPVAKPKGRPDRVPAKPIARINPRLRPMALADSHLPAWLQQLLQVQQGVWIGTIVLSVLTLGTYGWSVYSQQQWGQAYRHLEQLRRNERQLISSSEMMKNQIADRMDAKELGLAPQVANDVIFLQPAPPHAAAASPSGAPAAPPAANKPPLGY
jgi:hypothetical protein